MGFIRGSLLVLASIVLFFCFLLGSLFLTFNLSLEYNHVKPELKNLVLDLVEDQENIARIITQNLQEINLYCQNYSEYTFTQEEYDFVIDCSKVSGGIDVIIDNGVDNFVDKIYYDNYNCGFWSCIKNGEKPFVFVSKTAQDYWSSKFYAILVFSLIVLGVMFILVEHKPNFLILSGGLLVVISLLFRKLGNIFSFIDNSLSDFVHIFFSKGGIVFLITLIIGIVVLGLGIVWRVLRWEHTKKKFSKNDVKEIIKEEIKKNKEKVKKK